MNSGVRLNHCGVVWSTILFSLISTGLNMFCGVILNTFIFLIIIQTNDCVVECLDACVHLHIVFVEKRINYWGVHLNIYINVRVQLLHLSSAFPICSNRFLLWCWMLVLLLICTSFDNVLLFSLSITEKPRAHSCYFLLLMKFMSITRHEVQLVYFSWTNCFHTIFGVTNWFTDNELTAWWIVLF